MFIHVLNVSNKDIPLVIYKEKKKNPNKMKKILCDMLLEIK